MGSITAKLDELGKPAWVALMVVSFILFWPAGLAVLAYMVWSGRMGHGHWQEKMVHMQEKASRWCSGHRYPSSGNSAFDEYREETLRRLEDEQKEFREFLERLRHAKDKSEFDQFMADRRRPPQGPTAQAEV
jgi:hypothetical protein